MFCGSQQPIASGQPVLPMWNPQMSVLVIISCESVVGSSDCNTWLKIQLLAAFRMLLTIWSQLEHLQ